MFQTTWVCAIATIALVLTHVTSEVKNTSETCGVLYEKGVEAYLENNFKGCVKYFEAAVEKYRLYIETLRNCRIQCKENVSESQPLYAEDIEDLHFFEKTLKNTLCILKCRREYRNVFGLYNINKETEKLFEDRKPYEYLHICYFQTLDYQKAASSAFTYLVAHPDDKSSLASLKHYTSFPEAAPNEVINYEAKEYVYLYVHGSDAYDKGNWERVIQNMEESLILYLHAEEECRAQCEGPYDPGWYPDFIPSIANHFTYCLQCKRKCRDKLSSLNGEKYDDLVPSHYHYLQYAYYKVGKLKSACQAVASFLLLYPDHHDMKRNVQYYKSLPEVTEEYFTPRKEAIRYMKREAYETKLLKFIDEEFNNISKTGYSGEKEENNLKVEIIKSPKELNGTQRYIAESFLTQNQCNSLIDVIKLFAIIGDGYTDNKTPHSAKELFGGISFTRLTFVASLGLVNITHLKTVVEVSEKAKSHIENYFKVKNLYYSYTHLVCRSAIPGSQNNRTDFSHSVHADNCNLKRDGSCIKAFPSYTSRDYSAIIYLNDDISGGDFVFVSDYDGKQVQSSVQPKCGRMVAFSSGAENLHGVKAVTKGTRCAIAIWFTSNSSKTEDRMYAYKMIENQF